MDTKKERENEAGRITGYGIKTPGGWLPKCTVVVFRGNTLLGEQGQLINAPVKGGPFKTQEEAAQVALDAGSDWFEKNVPTDY